MSLTNFRVNLVSLVATVLTGAVHGAPLVSAQMQQHDVYMVIKGGISLGSYETGVNRVLLKGLEHRKNKILSFSGASAGSINGVLSVIEGCIVDKSYTIRSDNQSVRLGGDHMANFMRKVWDIGINELAPDQLSDDEKADTAVLSRSGHNKIKPMVISLLNREAKQGCRMNLSMSVTKLIPKKTYIKVLGSTVQQQRFVVSLVVDSVIDSEGVYRLRFKNNYAILQSDSARAHSIDHPNKELSDSIPSKYIFLPESKDGTIDVQYIWQLAVASSAFPVAFQAVKLPVCFHSAKKPVHQNKCLLQNSEWHLFSDGGMFDNAPIGVAIDTMFQKGEDDSEMSPNLLLYINPDSYRLRSANKNNEERDAYPLCERLELVTRLSTNQSGEQCVDPVIALGDMARYAGRILLTAHEKEYTSAIRSLKDRDNVKFVSTNRFHNLTADFHMHFGAFYADEYRVHDYLVGMYDAYHLLAMLDCEQGQSRTDECIENELHQSLENLQPTSSMAKSDFRNHFIQHSHVDGVVHVGEVSHDASGKTHSHPIPVSKETPVYFNQEHWEFLKYLFFLEFKESPSNTTTFTGPSNIFMAINQSFDAVAKDETPKPDYVDFITRLKQTKNIKSIRKSQDMQRIVENGRTYTEQKITVMLDNLLALQNSASACEHCIDICPEDCDSGQCSDACKTANYDRQITKYLTAAKPFVASALSQHRTNIWPKSVKVIPNLTMDFRWGLNFQQKNQVFSVTARSTTDALSKMSLSIDYGFDFNRFGTELDKDHYYSVHTAITSHREDMLFTSYGLGVQRDSKGDRFYPVEHTQVFGNVSFLNEVLTLKLQYSFDNSANKSRDDLSLIMTTDVIQAGKFLCDMLC